MNEIPDGWVEAEIGEIARIETGNTPPKGDPRLYAREVCFYKPGDLDVGGVVSTSHDMVSQAGADAGRLLPADTLLVTCIGNLGKSALIANPAICNQQINAVLPSPVAEPRYLYHWSRTIRSWLEENSSATTVAIINKGRFSKAPIRLAPLPEQRRIVAKIDSLTGKSRRARGHLDHIPRLVEKYKQAVLAAAFRGDLTREWRREQPRQLAVLPRDASRIRQRYADVGDFLPPYDVPVSWRWLRLPQLGDLDRGKSRHRPRNDKRLFGGAYPFIQTGEVRQADRFLTTYRETYSDFGLEQSRLWPVGTVCITIAANIAETAILAIDACFPDSVVGFLPDTGKAGESYVEFFLRTARGELEAFAPATAQKNINLDTLATVRVPTAPLAEQNEIIRRIETAFVWIDRLATEATSARRLINRLDQSVLAKAFRGELVPQDPADEPASVLLERIRVQRASTTPARRKRHRTTEPIR